MYIFAQISARDCGNSDGCRVVVLLKYDKVRFFVRFLYFLKACCAHQTLNVPLTATGQGSKSFYFENQKLEGVWLHVISEAYTVSQK